MPLIGEKAPSFEVETTQGPIRFPAVGRSGPNMLLKPYKENPYWEPLTL